MVKWVLDEENGNYVGLPTKKVKPNHLRCLSPMAWKILKELANEPSYPKALAKKLKVHEQKVYYHIRNLKKVGLIKVVKQEDVGGIVAKYYGIDKPSFTLTLKEPEPIKKLNFLKKHHEEFLEPFVKNGKLNALFVVGSTEPHGVHKAKAEDAPHGMMTAMFFGTFINDLAGYHVKWDTEVTSDDLKNNLILIGGPAINRLTSKANNKLPVKFMKRGNYYHSVYSSLSKKHYTTENVGMVVKAKSPFDKSRQILVIAGRRYTGTQAAVLSLIKNFDEICKGNKHNPKVYAKVVEGYDLDADGRVDSVEIKE